MESLAAFTLFSTIGHRCCLFDIASESFFSVRLMIADDGEERWHAVIIRASARRTCE